MGQNLLLPYLEEYKHPYSPAILGTIFGCQGPLTHNPIGKSRLQAGPTHGRSGAGSVDP